MHIVDLLKIVSWGGNMEHVQNELKTKKKSLWERFKAWMASRLIRPALPFQLSFGAMLLCSPALFVGLQFDDYIHRLIMIGLDPIHQGFWGKIDLFGLHHGSSITDSLRNIGIFPWWTSEHFKISFLRLLSGFTMWIDYQLWPNRPFLMHLQSLLWYGALVAAAAVYYRRIMGLTVIAGLAALFYAIDFSHASPTAWLANRNALQAVLFGFLCLIFYDRYQRERRERHRLASASALALALLSGETGVGTLAYLFSYAIFLDREPWRRRIMALWPHALVLIAWAGAYRMFGYGSFGSGAYIDPLASPLPFITALAARMPLLLMGQWSHITAESPGILMSIKTAYLFAAVLIGLLAAVFIPLVRKDRTARFWLAGLVLALIPVCGTEPNNRLLLFSDLGAMGLAAQFIIHLKGSPGVFPASRIWRAPALLILFYLIAIRLIFSPLIMPLYAYQWKIIGTPFANAARSLPNNDHQSGQSLIIVNPPVLLTGMLIASMQIVETRTSPAIRELSRGDTDVKVYRVDACTLRVRIANGLLGGNFGKLFRSDEEPIAVNQEIDVSGMGARIAQVGKNGPEEILYRFAVPLEDPSLRWLQWKGLTYVPFTPPAIGQAVSLPAFKWKDLSRNDSATKSPVQTSPKRSGE